METFLYLEPQAGDSFTYNKSQEREKEQKRYADSC